MQLKQSFVSAFSVCMTVSLTFWLRNLIKSYYKESLTAGVL